MHLYTETSTLPFLLKLFSLQVAPNSPAQNQLIDAVQSAEDIFIFQPRAVVHAGHELPGRVPVPEVPG